MAERGDDEAAERVEYPRALTMPNQATAIALDLPLSVLRGLVAIGYLAYTILQYGWNPGLPLSIGLTVTLLVLCFGAARGYRQAFALIALLGLCQIYGFYTLWQNGSWPRATLVMYVAEAYSSIYSLYCLARYLRIIR